ncbi:MAG: MinD/ParA family protein [Desulfobacterales bacterium]|nr:MinD/ParA family protein [Desulfobacterales bacterium]
MARVITIASGKGGVGKTNISVNLSLYLASRGYRTCLFDADLGLANINILLGIYPEYNLKDVILRQKSIKEILIRSYYGIDIIPGSSGVEMMANLDYEQIDPMVQSLSKLDFYDFLIFDTSAGVSKNVVSFCMASSEIILVVTPEPTSLTDAYALLKILSINGFKDSAGIIINQSKSSQIAKIAYSKLKETVQKFLQINILPIGIIAHDSHVLEAVKAQKPFVSLYPNSNASKCIKNIANQIINNKAGNIDNYSLETFWTRCLKILKSPLRLSGGRNNKEAALKKSQPINFADKNVLLNNTIDSVASQESANYPKMNEDRKLCQEIRNLSNILIQNFSLLTEEIKGIRKAMEMDRNNLSEPKALSASGNKSEPEIIPLDFEAFLKRKKNHVENQTD